MELTPMVMLVSAVKSFNLNAPVLSQLTSAKVKSMETRVQLSKINPALAETCETIFLQTWEDFHAILVLRFSTVPLFSIEFDSMVRTF